MAINNDAMLTAEMHQRFVTEPVETAKMLGDIAGQIDEMPGRVDLKFNDRTSQERIQSRGDGVLETYNGENVYSYVADSAVLGLLSRGDDDAFGVYNGQVVVLYVQPSSRLLVAVEAADAIVASATMCPLSE